MRILITIIFGLSNLYLHFESLKAQSCGSHLTEPIPFEYLQKLAILPRSNETDTVGLAVFVIRGTQNTGNVLPDFQTSLEWVNTIYKDAGLYFFVCSWIEEDGNSVYDLRDLDLLNAQRYMDHRLNIYIVDRLRFGGYDWAGFGIYPWTGNNDDRYISMINSDIRHPQLMAHEIGHFYGLLHTHEIMHGFELVDRSNCKTAGDQCCDTPADPYLGPHNMSGCSYNGNQLDPRGKPYFPLTHFIMSYAPYNCVNKFSNEQLIRIRQNAENVYYNMVNDCSNLPDISLTANFTSLSISFLDTLEIPLEISHTLQEDGLTDITVYLQDEMSEDEFVIHTESILLTTSTPIASIIVYVTVPSGVSDGLKTLRVKVDGARQIIEADERNNESIITFTIDNSGFENALIFPNPANDILTLFYRDERASENLIVEIVDVQGRILIKHAYETWNATFYDRFIISSLHEGLYFLRLRHSHEGNLKILPFVKG